MPYRNREALANLHRALIRGIYAPSDWIENAAEALSGQPIKLADPVFAAHRVPYNKVPSAAFHPVTGQFAFIGVKDGETARPNLHVGFTPFGEPGQVQPVRFETKGTFMIGPYWPRTSEEPAYEIRHKDGSGFLVWGGLCHAVASTKVEHRPVCIEKADGTRQIWTSCTEDVGGLVYERPVMTSYCRINAAYAWEEMNDHAVRNPEGITIDTTQLGEVGGRLFWVELTQDDKQRVHWGDWTSPEDFDRVVSINVGVTMLGNRLVFLTLEQCGVHTHECFLHMVEEDGRMQTNSKGQVVTILDDYLHFFAGDGRIFYIDLHRPSSNSRTRSHHAWQLTYIKDLVSGFEVRPCEDVPINGVPKRAVMVDGGAWLLFEKSTSFDLVHLDLTTRSPHLSNLGTIEGATSRMKRVGKDVAIEVKRDGKPGILWASRLNEPPIPLFADFDRLTPIEDKNFALSWHFASGTIFLTKYVPPR